MTAGAWHVGNAVADTKGHRGWLVGHFIDDDDLRRSQDVEIKWGIHPSGDKRPEWQSDEFRTTVLLLIKGVFRIDLSTESFVLRHEGDYAMWGHGVAHSWYAEENSVVITVRWPSSPPPA